MTIEYRAEVIGSMLRPAYLKDARKLWEAGFAIRIAGARTSLIAGWIDWWLKSRIACGDEGSIGWRKSRLWIKADRMKPA